MGQHKKSKVKILNTSYNKDTDIIRWFILDVNENRNFTLAWKSDDLGPALGINKVIPKNLIEDFCKQMMGKEINLVMQPEDIGINASNLNDATEEDLNKFNATFQPYQDIIREVLSEEEKNDKVE